MQLVSLFQFQYLLCLTVTSKCAGRFSTVLSVWRILQMTLLTFSLYRFTIKSAFQLLEELGTET